MTTTSNARDSSRLSRHKALLAVLALFLLSLIPRIQAFTGPIQGGHTWLTAHTVMTLQIWFDHGITTYNFNPIYTYKGDVNRHMKSLTSGLVDKDGDYYYVSYGAFSFLFAFAIFKTLGIYPTFIALKVLNLFIHLFTCWLVYLVICRFFRKPVKNNLYKPALYGTIIYMFSMHPLWCHTYIYFADTLIHPLWLLAIYVALGIFLEDKIKSSLHVWGFSLLIFISIYTEWLGLFFAGAAFLVALLYSFKDKAYLKLLVAIAIPAILAVGLFVFQFSAINDFDAFVDASFNKYTQRSGYDKQGFYLKSLNWQFVFKHYVSLYYPILATIVFLSITALIVKAKEARMTRKGEYAVLFTLILLPILIHHNIFLGFTKIHDFALLKFSIFAAIFIGILFKVILYDANRELKNFPQIFTSVILALMLVLSLISFYDLENFDYRGIFDRAAYIVNKTASDDEALYILSESDKANGIMVTTDDFRSISPQIQMLTKRNFLGARDKNQVLKHMNRHGLKKGRIYTVSKAGNIINIEAVSLP